MIIFRSCSGLSLLMNRSSRSGSPGPSSLSYFLTEGTESAWQQSSCGRRRRRPSFVQSRSKRSTTSVFFSPNVSMRVLATGMPSMEMSRMQRCSFSTESDRSTPLASRPICGLRIWVVAVVPCGMRHSLFQYRRAVFSCAPASEMRNPSSMPTPSGLVVKLARIPVISSSLMTRP